MFTQERKKEVLKNKDNNKNSGVVRNKYGTGVRSYLVNSGLNNSDIGYENNQVTYKGKPVLSPNIVVDGTSYADEDSLRSLALDLNRQEGKDLVSAKDFMSQKTGIKNGASIDNGYVAVGDNLIKATVASDGNAYVERSDMEDAVDDYKTDIGYKSELDIYNDWNNRFGSKIEKAIDSILNETWEYNIEDDPAYQAYAKMYKREGERAFSDAYGNAIASTGGYENSNALTLANQGLDYYMSKLSDKIPELMDANFERYSKGREQRLQAIGELMELGSEAYDNLYTANNDYLDRISEANTENYEQKLKSDEAELAKRKTESGIYKDYLEAEKGLIDLEYLPKQYESKLWDSAIKRALDEIELEYKPQLYDMELEFEPQMYEAEIAEKRKNNILKDLEARYFLYRK